MKVIKDVVRALHRFQKEQSTCGNRMTFKYLVGNIPVELVIRDPNLPDNYSREELCGMLKLIREQEKKQDWKVPEPA